MRHLCKAKSPSRRYSRSGRTVWCAMLVSISSAAGPAAGQSEMIDVAKAAFFHVSVTGTPADPNKASNRQGKAFAISPSLLVTAQHLVGDAEDWKSAAGIPNEIARATRPLDRLLTLTRAAGSGPSDSFADAIVLPAPSYGLDAAGLSLPDAVIERHFRLSLCDIVKGDRYAAVMTEASDPADPGSVNRLAMVDLEARGYEPARFGALYVFGPLGNPRFQGDPEGHDGSPILDTEGNVVALISAVTADEGGRGHLILGTPIQPLFPGAATLLARAPEIAGGEQALKCSLSDTVRRINDQVAAHAIWSLQVDRDADGRPTDEVGFRYENMGDTPNIKAIRIEYDFFGKQRKSAPITRLQYPDEEPNDTEVVDEDPGTDRELSTVQVVREGKEKLEKFLKDKNQGGYIDSVQIRIYEATLLDGRKSEKLTFLNLDWTLP